MEVNLLKYEEELHNKGFNFIAGCDEAGRGPLVGPVVASAVILPENYYLEDINDSKQLSSKKREILYDIIMRDAISVGIGVVDAKKIDEINILEASRLAMNTALDNLNVKPDYILTDAMKLNRDVPVLPIIHGDALSETIAASSIIAKVTRDRLMIEYGKLHPLYEFDKHKGYPTKKHIELIKKYGILNEYRMTFKPIKDMLRESSKNGSK